MPSISKVFNIAENYSLEELKNSYINIIENLSKSDRSEIEKDLLSEQYKKLYKQGKKLYLERVTFETDIEANDNSNELYDRFDRHDRFGFGDLGSWDPFIISSYPYTYGNSRNISRRYNDPFSRFDNVYGEMMNQMNQIHQMNIESNSNSNIKSQVYSYSSSYRSTTNPDGSRTIIESKSESKNGDKKKTINAYKKMSDGKIIPLSEDEMKQIENSHQNDSKQITNNT
jgi:hypothetical protein